MNNAKTVATYCNDDASTEAWTLADFCESNAEDPSCTEWATAIEALEVGSTFVIDSGAGGVTKITRLT